MRVVLVVCVGMTFSTLFSLSTPAAATPLVRHSDGWRYHKGTTTPQAQWQTVSEATLDGSWLGPAPGGFGYGDGDDATVLSDMRNGYTTLYIRRTFVVPSGVDPDQRVELVVDWDDGFVAWLDGVEVARRLAPGAAGTEPARTATATANHEASAGGGAAPETFDLGTVGSRLTPGTHVLALMGLNVNIGSSDFSLIADLNLVAPSLPPLVAHSDPWRYRKGTSAPPAGWQTLTDAALDGTWLTGPGGIGYGDGDDATVLSDMRNHYTTVYLRQSFTVSAPFAANLHAMLIMDWDDGFVAWLDGVEVARDRAPGAAGVEPPYNAVATGLHESTHGGTGTTFDLGPAATLLPPGPHVLAIMGLNESLTSSDLSVIADLVVAEPPPPPPGAITTNTTWRLSQSPIIVSDDVTVAPGVTLTIEPGVVVRFDQGRRLTVNGRLLAEGTAQQRILFTRNVGAGSWHGIVIHGQAGSPETRIAYAHLEFNSSTAIHSAGGTVYLDHLTFGTTSHQYLSLDDSSFIVSHCTFPTATAGFELVHGTGGIKSGGHGVFLSNFFGATQGYNDVVDFTGGNRPGPIVQFLDNVFLGASDDHLDLDGTDAWVEGNIFLHAHRNGSPDTASAVSGGDDGSRTSEITILRNLIYDCDQAAMAKQGNFYVLLNNTIVHQTHQGGQDTDGAVVAVADAGTAQAAGMYLEGNIIFDAEKLVRFHTTAQVTFRNNFMSLPWNGPGGGNSSADPKLRHVPTLSETYFTNWADAQIMWEWFSLQPDSPALGAGALGVDAGAVIPSGVVLSGVPTGTTSQTDARIDVGWNRTGFGIPTSGWPAGAGYTHYKWRLDTNGWSAEIPISTPIILRNLTDGPHHLEVVGRRDAGLYQDDPIYGDAAVVTVSKTWTVQAHPLRILSAEAHGLALDLTFEGQAGQTYSLLRSDTLVPAHWASITNLPSLSTSGVITVTDPRAGLGARHFYRIVTPAQP